MAGSAVVGTLRVVLGMDTAEFTKASVAAAREADKWSKSWAGIGRQASQLGKTLTSAVTLPMAALGGGAVKAAMDFESSFAGIRKTVGDATDSMGNLTDTGRMLQQGMRDLAKQIPVNVNELNRIGEAAGQLGIRSENILGFTEVMAKLGVTTNLTSDQAATSLARLANITQMPQDQFDRLGSTVVQLGNNFATTESEIVDFGLRIAGAGKQAGMSEPQILAIGTALSSVGVQAEAGGTAVQKVILQMLQATVTGGKGLETFAATAGMTGAEFKRAFEQDAGAAFTAFVEGLGRQGKNAITVLNDLGLADERLIRAFLALSGAGDLLNQTMREGEAGWRENTALAKEAEQRFRTVASQMQTLWNKVNDLGIALGTVLLPHVIKLVDMAGQLVPYLETAVKWFSALPEPVQDTALAVGALVAAVGPMVWLFGKIAEASAIVVGAFGAKGVAAKLLGKESSLLTSALGRVVGAVAAVGATLTAGWQFGKWIDSWSDLSGEIGMFLAMASGVPPMEAIASRAAYDSAKAHREQAQAIRETEEAYRALIGTKKRAQGDVHLPTDFDPKPPSGGGTPPLVFGSSAADDVVEARQRAAESLANHERQLRQQQRREEEAAALEAIRRAEQGYQALSGVQQRLADADAKRQLTSLGYQFFTINQWLAAEKAKYMGSLREAEIFAALEQEAQQRRHDAVMASQQDLVKAGEDAGRRIGEAFLKSARETKDTWSSFFKTDLPAVIGSAIQGGGDVTRAIGAAFGSKVSSALGGALKNSMAKAAEAGTGFFASGFGKMVGKGLGLAMPIVGPLVGQFGAKLIGVLGNALGLGSAGRDLVKEYAEKMGGFDALREKLNGLGDEGERLWKTLTQGVGRNNADQARKAIEQVERGLAAYEERQQRVVELQQELQDKFGGLEGALERFGGRAPSQLRGLVTELLTLNGLTAEQTALLQGMLSQPGWREMEEAAQRLGVSLSSLGPAFAQGKLSEQALQTVRDLQFLEEGGADMNAVLRDSAKHIQDLVDTAMRTGSVLPETLRPYIQRLIDMELLTDPNGDLVTNIDQLSFADIEDDALQAIKGILEQIRDILAVQIPDAAREASRALNDVNAPTGRPADDGTTTDAPHGNPQYDAEGNPRGFSKGGWGNFGAGTPAVLHGKEAIFPLPPGFSMGGLQYTLESVHDMVGGIARGASYTGGGPSMVVVMERDGQREAEWLVPFLPGAEERLAI